MSMFIINLSPIKPGPVVRIKPGPATKRHVALRVLHSSQVSPTSGMLCKLIFTFLLPSETQCQDREACLDDGVSFFSQVLQCRTHSVPHAAHYNVHV
jgi:hypothetical protein